MHARRQAQCSCGTRGRPGGPKHGPAAGSSTGFGARHENCVGLASEGSVRCASMRGGWSEDGEQGERRDAPASLYGRMAVSPMHRVVAPPDAGCPISGGDCVCACRHCPLCKLRFGRRVYGVDAAHRTCSVVESRNASVRCGLCRAVYPAMSGTGESARRGQSVARPQGRGQAGRRALCGRKCAGGAVKELLKCRE